MPVSFSRPPPVVHFTLRQGVVMETMGRHRGDRVGDWCSPSGLVPPRLAPITPGYWYGGILTVSDKGTTFKVGPLACWHSSLCQKYTGLRPSELKLACLWTLSFFTYNFRAIHCPVFRSLNYLFLKIFPFFLKMEGLFFQTISTLLGHVSRCISLKLQ